MCTCTCSPLEKENQIVDQAVTIISERLFKRGESIASPQDARRYIQLKLMQQSHESFGVAFLDARHRVIAFEILSVGSLTFATVYPRVVLERALAHSAAAVILAHNNPSGCTQPSVSDELSTRAVKDALKIVDIQVLDHLVVGQGEPYSFVEHGLLYPQRDAQPCVPSYFKNADIRQCLLAEARAPTGQHDLAMHQQTLLALIALLSFAQVCPAAPSPEVLVISDRSHPVKLVPGARLIELDAPARLQAELTKNLPTTPEAAIAAARRRFANPANQRRWLAAHQGVIEAFNLGVSRIPAVVVDRRYVVYGVTDIPHALSLIDRFRSTQ